MRIRNSEKSDKCGKCEGHGIVRQEEVKCDICYGNKCIKCNERGYKVMPYDECDKCFGEGIIVSK